MSRIYRLHGPRDLRCEQHTLGNIGPWDVHLRSRLGAVSTGTESAWYFGTDPQLDPEFKPLRFDRAEFPRVIGYEKVAEVVAVGSEVEDRHVGQRVVARYGHAEEHLWPAESTIPVPDDVPDEEAIFSVLMNVTSHGVRRSRLCLGEDVVITGMGPLGLLTLIAARQAGASTIVACDRYEKRLALARHFGANETFRPGDGGTASSITDAYGTEAFDVSFECSSSYEALADGMAVLKRNGRACIISQLKGPYPRHPAFGMDFHLGELEMISSDGGWEPQAQARWFFGSLRRGSISDITRMVSHRISFEDLESAFGLIEHTPEDVAKILITYPE